MFDKIKLLWRGFFDKAIAAFKSFFNAAFPIAKQIIIGQLRDIAGKVVLEVSNSTVITDEAKRKEAFKRISAYAKNEGIEARDHLINLAIEMAVSALKEK